MDKLSFFLSNVKLEIKSIDWPNRKDVWQSMLIITFIILVFSFILWLLDLLFTFLMSKIF